MQNLFSCSAFGGFSCKLVNLLSDEYSSKSLMSVAVSPPTLPEYTFASCGGRLAGSLLTVAGLLAGSGLTLPLSLATQWFPLRGQARRLPFLSYRPELGRISCLFLLLIVSVADPCHFCVDPVPRIHACD
jgi:hypothetical protein